MTGTSSRFIMAVAAVAALTVSGTAEAKPAKEKIGVVFVHHGGMDQNLPWYNFDAGILQFVHDQNAGVYRGVIWNPYAWGGVVTGPDSERFRMKYNFQYGRIGGVDPFNDITNNRLYNQFLQDLIPIAHRNGVEIEADWSGWIPGGPDADHFPYPRYVYNSPFTRPPFAGVKMNYCGEKEPGANGQPWPGCNKERFNVDGPFERLANKGVSRIFMVDLIVGGVRFYKGYDVYTMAKRALASWSVAHNGTKIPLTWINDPKDLMASSYPTAPANWTGTLGAPAVDPKVPLAGHPNPVIEDPMLARLNAEGIIKAFNDGVPLDQTGIVLLSHYYRPNDWVYDPKINDTIELNERVEAYLLKVKPQLVSDNIIGAFLGLKEVNPETGRRELTRAMRGEDIGGSNLYESTLPPAPKQNFRLWDALEYLKNRGMKHIVIAMPQINADSVLSLSELPTQVAREIGTAGWRPLAGELACFQGPIKNPFPDYYGVWAKTDCGGVPCCFTMGGCSDGRPYPPARQTPVGSPTAENDPWLVYDINEYGHLGYDPTLGPPNPAQPVQDQYRGTWSMWRPSNDDPQLTKMLAHQVEKAMWDAGIGKMHGCGMDEADVGFGAE